ncbi:MAG TPA: sulfotransferase domain-containing protein [Bryobacteraceae bacterium]|nr:sulfotransferase domain-containing protein [Bryobacteraceae bacterium]
MSRRYVGHLHFDGTPEQMIARARVGDQPWFIKIHEHEFPEDEKAIYVVRDGRAAMASYRNFQRDIGKRDFSLEDIVSGKPPLVSWSEHVRWGLERSRETTLLLHYEELTCPSQDTFARIAAFTGLPVLRPFDVEFGELHAVRPELYGKGSNESGIAEVETRCSDLFWRVNGDAMQALGYSRGVNVPSPIET